MYSGHGDDYEALWTNDVEHEWLMLYADSIKEYMVI